MTALPIGIEHCPNCNHVGPPARSQSVSALGWVLFFCGLLLCFPLCWVPLIFCKDFTAACGYCRLVLKRA